MGSCLKQLDNPWPHIEFEEFLAPEIAQYFSDHWPASGWTWLKHSDVVQPDGTSLRKYQRLEDVFPGYDHIRLGLSRFFDVSGLYLQSLLIEDSPGYFIRRHTDCAGKVVSAQVYFPDKDAPETQGVILCDRLGGSAKQIPYRFNHGYAFKVTDHSWHKVAKAVTRRRSLQLIYYDTPNPKL